MRRKKKERLKQEAFWSNFLFFSTPKGLEEVPAHLARVNFRIWSADDESLRMMAEKLRSVDQLDLDETDITNEGIGYLAQLDSIKELRLKGCSAINDDCLPDLYRVKGLELLHLGGTSVTVKGLANIGVLKQLKHLLISAGAHEKNELDAIAVELPPGCVFTVNHKDYQLGDAEAGKFSG